MPISTVDPSIPTSPLSHLPPGHPEPTSPHLRSSHLTEKELDAARIHVYLLFYEEHALLWSSIEQHFGEWSEKRLNGAMALLEELVSGLSLLSLAHFETIRFKRTDSIQIYRCNRTQFPLNPLHLLIPGPLKTPWFPSSTLTLA